MSNSYLFKSGPAVCNNYCSTHSRLAFVFFPSAFIVVCRDGELVLMDAGSEFHGYASDITRTWPVSGKFSNAQRELYELVLRVQKKCLKVRRILLIKSKLFAMSFE